MRTAQRPHGGGRRMGTHRGRGAMPMVGIPLGWWLTGVLLAAVWRFAVGQVVLRRPGRWDARYTRWAPPVPEELEASRAEGVPRSTWARRPGYQRQLVRLAVLAALVGWIAVPTLTVALVAVLALVWLLRVAVRWWQLAYYHRVCGTWLDWLSKRLEWEGVADDPRRWVDLPRYGVTWEPVAPLRSALLRTGDPDGDGDGWLVRCWPWLAGRLEPLATPIAEQRWVRWLCDPAPSRRPALAVALRAVGRRVVSLVEVSRRLRIRPRVSEPDLTNPDASLVIHYAPTYQAHDSNIGEVATVLAERLPGPAEDWEHQKDGASLTLTLYHRARLPRYVEWDRTKFEQSSLLRAPIGETARDVIVIDYKHATPHVNASGQTGTGKSVTFLVILGNFVYHGGHAVIVDPKRIDFVKPFRGLRNVDLVTVEDQFPKVLENVVAEMDRRYRIIEDCTLRADELGLPDMATNAELYFQPLMFAVDEKSRFTAKCKRWWKREGGGFDEKGKPIAGKGDSITVEWERDIVARGRAAAVYAMSAAQRNSIPNTFPDTDIRGNYQYKILSGPADAPAWAVTFPGTKMKKLSSQVRGRAIVGVGAELHETQLAYMDWREVRAAAQHGETICDAENQQRAELLAQVTGRPVWEVSPLPFWVPRPAETGESVPGPEVSYDSDTAPTEISSPRALEAVPAPPDDDNSGVVGTDDGPTESAPTGPVDTEPVDTEEDADLYVVPLSPREEVVGNEAAAKYLGVKVETFRRAATRSRARGEDILGVRVENRTNVYDCRALAEWWNQRPGSGRKAS